MSTSSLRSRLIRFAHTHPEFREQILPLVTTDGREAGWKSNPADAAEDKRRAENAARASKLDNDIRDALKAKGWIFTQGHSDANILAFDHEQQMSFRHKDLGSLSVRLYVNDDGK